jgi:endonuclease/exonuclease/phosphatase family metal-dependent hydrolase
MAHDALIGPVATPDLHVMTYNIRRRFSHHRPWGTERSAARSGLVRRLLVAEKPTLLGVQEALADQVDFVAEALGPDYLWVGNGRNSSGEDERCAVFYDTRRLELTDWKQRALSATPHEPGSRSWGNRAHRVVVSADFTDLATGARVREFNTHFDHLSWRSRIESAKFVMHLVQAARAAEPDAAIIVTGDFNAGVGSAAYRWLTAEGALRDAWDAAAERLTPQWAT